LPCLYFSAVEKEKTSRLTFSLKKSELKHVMSIKSSSILI